MLRIVMDVDRPVGQAIGIKEALAMDLERYGDVNFTQTTKFLRPQLSMLLPLMWLRRRTDT